MATPRLVLYDDVFPSLRSGFRLAELGAYLDHFSESRVAITNLSGPAALDATLRDYRALRPEHDGRIAFFTGDLALSAQDFLYTIFLNNAYDLLALSEGKGVPFAFQVYPGGGFGFGNEESDWKLRCVLESPMFSFMVVTQPAIRDYVTSRFGVPSDRLHLIGPGPVWTSPATSASPRRHLEHGKTTFDVGFIAHKYGNDTRSKGYDFFISLAREVTNIGGHVRFHVVGNYGPDDHPLDGIEERITFHGSLDAVAFESTCRSFDVVVSPNVPSVLCQGAFDGFPTASCSQAALAGAVVFATDPLGLNSALVPGRDFLLLERDPRETRPTDVPRAAEILRELAGDPARLAELSVQGTRAFEALVGPEAQITPRLALMERALSGAFPPRAADAGAWRAAAAAAHRRSLRERAEIARLHAVIDGAKSYIAQKEQNIADLLLELRRTEEARDYHRGQSELW